MTKPEQLSNKQTGMAFNDDQPILKDVEMYLQIWNPIDLDTDLLDININHQNQYIYIDIIMQTQCWYGNMTFPVWL